MPMYINGALVGMSEAVRDKEYQKQLSEKTSALLGDRTSISAKELKKSSLFKNAYKQLDAEGKKKFDAILNLDGDGKNVSEKELKTLMTLLDADLGINHVTNSEAFFMDGEFSTGKSGGIYQATDSEIQHVYQNTKTRAEIQAEEVAKLKADAQKLESIKNSVAQFDVSTGSGLTQALNFVRENMDIGNSDGLKLYDAAIADLFKGNIQNIETYRDGGSRLYTLKDGTTVYHDNTIFGQENGFVTITRPDGSAEKYNPEGEKVE